MSDALLFLAAPTVMCFILAGIHCYLGLHVLARGVIFVDLSLAQVAAFGTTIALLFGYEHGTPQAYFYSLGATFLAASLFALARRQERYFSQEAIIGITYAFGSAAVVLVVDRMAHGAEHIKELLVGQILWVTWPEVLKTALIYAGVGLVHYIFRKQLLEAAFHAGEKVKAIWDFLFYALFGVVITSSVSIVGVLQVFAYLIVPSIVSTLFVRTIRARLIFGWILGIVLSVVGMGASYALDYPSGAFIVVCFAAVPIVLLLLSPVLKFKYSPSDGPIAHQQKEIKPV
ncbi:MAG: metal ABC transporter permease [Proteobacteria bacterium]|nr:MAG: metal ABC transporter permease [Pseudomonadota bacterium]